MSGTLTWKIVVQQNNNSLPFQLRNIFQKKWTMPHILDGSDLEYLQGLADAEIEGAEELINLIDEHDEIEVNIEY